MRNINWLGCHAKRRNPVLTWTPVKLSAGVLMAFSIGPVHSPLAAQQEMQGYRIESSWRESLPCDYPAPFPAEWSAKVWPPGDTLVYHFSGEGWPADGVWLESAMALYQRAFDEWSAIQTADIAIRIEGPVDGLGPGRDGINAIVALEDSLPGPQFRTRVWREGNPDTGFSEIVEYDLVLGRQIHRWPTPEESPLFFVNVPLHGIGHHLGLSHSAGFPIPLGPNFHSGLGEGRIGAWPLDPDMSYGPVAHLPDAKGGFLRRDERIGVSLIRPRPGWLPTTGTISGFVHTVGRKPVRGAHVWALQHGEDGTVDGVGAFSCADGTFTIQGLSPGDYTLYAHPDQNWLANYDFYTERQGDLQDVLLLLPVRVVAGQVTDGVEIEMRPGRSQGLP